VAASLRPNGAIHDPGIHHVKQRTRPGPLTPVDLLAAAALPTAVLLTILAWPVVTGVPTPPHLWAGLFIWAAVRGWRSCPTRSGSRGVQRRVDCGATQRQQPTGDEASIVVERGSSEGPSI